MQARTRGVYTPPPPPAPQRAWIPLPPPAAAPTPPEKFPVKEIIALTAAIVATFAQGYLFFQAFGHLDQPRPLPEEAKNQAVWSIWAGIAALIPLGVLSFFRRPSLIGVAGGFVVGMLMGFQATLTLESKFGDTPGQGWASALQFYYAFLFLVVIAGVILVFVKHPAVGWALNAGGVTFHSVLYFIVAWYAITNRERLAREAEAAYAPDYFIPGLEVIAVFAVVAATFLLWRRRTARTGN